MVEVRGVVLVVQEVREMLETPEILVIAGTPEILVIVGTPEILVIAGTLEAQQEIATHLEVMLVQMGLETQTGTRLVAQGLLVPAVGWIILRLREPTPIKLPASQPRMVLPLDLLPPALRLLRRTVQTFHPQVSVM